MNYRFEPTGEVRPPERGEYFLNRNGEVLCVKDDCPRVPCEIYRRVPHEDTSCEVAFVSAAKTLREIASAALREATAANEGEHPIECWKECTCGRLERMTAIHQACVKFDAALSEATTHTTPRGEA